MAWFTGSADDPVATEVTPPPGPEGWCHAVDPELGISACGTCIRNLRVWIEIPWIRARMAGGELCPTCVVETEREHAPV